ncbi:MAG: hypothetical protein QNJ18_13070 [Xenococcaceae cyanobacterium MO_167.B52]|nr:hypothetical protein [Xenococcaceae cyanobacterium MO_167.B52]
MAKHIRRPRKGKYSRFFGTFGIITLILLLDDLFLFHEVIAPGIFMISETIVYGGYGLVILASLINFRKIILQSEWGLFGLAFVFLGLSIVIDSLPVLDNMSTDLNYLIEDGFKLLGIVSWFGYFMIFSYQVLKPELILKKG